MNILIANEIGQKLIHMYGQPLSVVSLHNQLFGWCNNLVVARFQGCIRRRNKYFK